ncbi:MAG: ArsC/Spx/MgsR family protein [bacterium]|jgi:arsenate reductase|nr:arsenate reductase (glutaredoxin) [Planctomycetota bacterium]HIL51238.1 arsenate reductase (glutaredoxin) [Planctomycetota bacterium]
MPLQENPDTLLLLHNPLCSKSRAVEAILEQSGHEFVVRCYLDEPLDEQELRELEELLGRPVGEWVRRGESSFAEAGLRADSDAGALRAAMVRCPILMERPIALRAGRAVVGRPPEAVRGLF